MLPNVEKDFLQISHSFFLLGGDSVIVAFFDLFSEDKSCSLIGVLVITSTANADYCCLARYIFTCAFYFVYDFFFIIMDLIIF